MPSPTDAGGAKSPRPWLDWYRDQRWRGPNGRRIKQLAAEPWCRFHAKRGERVKATTVDHIEPHRGDPDRFWNGALQSLCHHCHSAVKQSHEAGRRFGCDAAGAPTDPSHPWFEGGKRSGKAEGER